MTQIVDIFRPRPVLEVLQIGDEIWGLEQFERGEMIEVEGRGKHRDELELEFKPSVAAIERLGGIWFEDRWGRLDGGKSRSFVDDTLCHLSLTFTERQMGLGVGLTPIKGTK